MSHKYVLKPFRAKPPPGSTPTATMTKYQEGLRTTVVQSPHYNDDPSIGLVFTKWSTVTDQLDAVHKQIVTLLPQLVALRGQEGVLRTQYQLEAEQFFSTLRSVFVTNVAALNSMGIEETVSALLKHLITTPLKLRAVPIKGQPTRFWTRWHAVEGAGIYDLQRCNDPATEAGYGTVYSDKYARFEDAGVLGQIVWYRVRARGNGVSGWSAPIAYVIR